MPIVDVELKRDVPRARRGYVKYAATAIAAVLFLHGAATFALHHRLHLQGHGRHHSIDGERTGRQSSLPTRRRRRRHAPAAAAHAAAERLKAKPDHKPDGGRPQAPPPRKTPPAKKARQNTPAKTPPRKTLWQPPARGTGAARPAAAAASARSGRRRRSLTNRRAGHLRCGRRHRGAASPALCGNQPVS